jgi:hypothetical protein
VKPYYAVLTGDIVGSSSLTPAQHRLVVGRIKSARELFPDTVIGQIDVFSGDSWQMLVTDFDSALRTALFLRASLKREKDFSADSRVSIAWGDLDMDRVNTDRISESTGDLFTLSGRGLGEMKKPVQMVFSMLYHSAFSFAATGCIQLIDALVCQWSPEQARAVSETLTGKTQVEISDEFGIGQSSVHKSLYAANWPEIESALDLLAAAGGEFLKQIKITLQGDN